MYRNICFGKIKFPRGAIGDDGKQFVKGVSTLRSCFFVWTLDDVLTLPSLLYSF